MSSMHTSPEYRPRILLTMGETATRLGVSRRTVYRLVEQEDARDRLPHTRFAGSVRIPSDLLEDWMDAHTWTGDSAA